MKYVLTLIFLFFGALTAEAQICDTQTVKAVIPQYPVSPMALKLGGEVKVEVTLDKNGNVTKAAAIEGVKVLHKISEETASEWQFSRLTGKSRSQCINRKTVLVFNYVALPSDTKSGSISRSFVVFPNRVEIRAIKVDIISNPSVDPSHIDLPSVRPAN